MNFFSRIARVLPVCLVLCGILPGTADRAEARTSNGNDFALYFSEAQTPSEKKALLEEARGRPHFFRYLQIMEMEEVERNGATVVRIVAFEPASLLDIQFEVTRSISKQKMKDDPVTKKGDAIAVTAKVDGAKSDGSAILLGSVIVRHKDRLSPALGNELLCDIDPNSVFYSYTGGKQLVQMSYKDRDLLKHRDRVIKEKGPQGWADFLERELAVRKKARAESGR